MAKVGHPLVPIQPVPVSVREANGRRNRSVVEGLHGWLRRRPKQTCQQVVIPQPSDAGCSVGRVASPEGWVEGSSRQGSLVKESLVVPLTAVGNGIAGIVQIVVQQRVHSTLLGNGYLMIPGIERIGRHGLLMGRIGTSAAAVVMVGSITGILRAGEHRSRNAANGGRQDAAEQERDRRKQQQPLGATGLTRAGFHFHCWRCSCCRRPVQL
uniref:(northern house mosquito) hypothetical protein n=1 Tax=Culex pipiens TaxID=7175 RepID=A0A8D8P8M6_CULPI